MAAIDALTGEHLVLIAALAAGPGCAVLTGRWRRTAASGLWAVGLAVACGAPDGIFGSGQHLALIASMATAAVVTTLAAAVNERFGQAPATQTPTNRTG